MNSSSSKEFLQELKEKAKSSVPEVAEERQTYVDPTDGTVYEWDSEKRGWFPKVLILFKLPLSLIPVFRQKWNSYRYSRTFFRY